MNDWELQRATASDHAQLSTITDEQMIGSNDSTIDQIEGGAQLVACAVAPIAAHIDGQPECPQCLCAPCTFSSMHVYMFCQERPCAI
jgi:hypothetical protein